MTANRHSKTAGPTAPNARSGSADKAPNRRSKTRSNRPALAAAARRNRCTRNRTDRHRWAWSRTWPFRNSGRSRPIRGSWQSLQQWHAKSGARAVVDLASASDRSTDFRRIGEDHVGTVAHHAGRDQRWCMLFRAFAARIRLQAQITFPELVRLPVCRGHGVSVFAVADGADTKRRFDVLEVGRGRPSRSKLQPPRGGYGATGVRQRQGSL